MGSPERNSNANPEMSPNQTYFTAGKSMGGRDASSPLRKTGT